MEELVKALVAAPASAVLLLAGLAFLGVAVFGRITERLDPGARGRIAAGVLGAIMISISLYMSAPASAPQPTAAPTVHPSSQSADIRVDASPSTDPISPPATSSGHYPVALAAGQVVKGEDRTYTILKIELDRHGIDQRALSFTVRMQNDSDYPVNFWNESFRLMIDGAATAPIGDLNELVEAHAVEEGTVSFALSEDAASVALQIDHFGPDAPGIAIALPAGR